MNSVDEILQSIRELPPFPAVVQRALQVVNDPRASADHVVDVIQYDQSITANVLKVCNSAYFGLRRTVTSLREAVVMIGFNQLVEIIMSQESSRFFYGPSKYYEVEYGELWKHSVACALLSRLVSRRLNREEKPAHFTAGLLHDIGKMILSKFVKDYFKEIKKLVEQKNVSFCEAEKEVLGIDHAELGGKITEQWDFPKNIVLAVRHHHTPFLTPEEHDAVQLIYLCNLIAMMTSIGGGADGRSYHAYEQVIEQYGLKEKDIERFILQLDDRFQLVKEVLNINRDVE
jgi:putative nucleotidyltransferase with HDIG domain